MRTGTSAYPGLNANADETSALVQGFPRPAGAWRLTFDAVYRGRTLRLRNKGRADLLCESFRDVL